ncbi:MAG: dependent oxidoreductase [Conexibacter sp.]|nr:dependent oxidoreductase [Conexibacter sp.]
MTDTLRIGPVLWLEQALARDAGAACPPLAGTVHADVCIVGGGFTGLWTALELAREAPDTRIVLLEAEGCGFGASGRNGGWATSWYDELDSLVAHFGAQQAALLAAHSSRAIDRIEELCGEEGIDCDLRRGGALIAATGQAQEASFEGPLAAARELGGDAVGRVVALAGAELRRRTGSPVLRRGVHLTDAAAIQPALLARGMREAALRRGVRIFEGTPVLELERTKPAVLVTRAGRVEAERVVVATGAWAARMRELRRAIVPVGSHIVVTEPIPELVRGLGWTGGELLGDARLLVHYAQVTRDGRIAFGRGGGAIGTAGRIRPVHWVDATTVATVTAGLRRWFPQLAGVRVTHAWGGAVDRAPGHLPFVGTLGDHENVEYGVGFSGNGVAPSALIGRILARRALGVVDELTTSALVSGPPGYLPPEPLRSLGAVTIQRAVARAEAAEERGQQASRADTALRGLLWFTMPRALEPRAWRRR